MKRSHALQAGAFGLDEEVFLVVFFTVLLLMAKANSKPV